MYGNDSGIIENDDTNSTTVTTTTVTTETVETTQNIDNDMTSNNENASNGTYDGYIKENYNTTGTYKDNITFGGFEETNPKPKKKLSIWILLIPVILIFLILIILLIVLSSKSNYTVKTKSITIKVGESETIKVTGSNKVLKKLTYSSADDGVATVNDEGKVTGVSIGNTKIWIGLNGKKSKSVNVIVNTNKTELILKETNITLEKDSTYQLVVTNTLSDDVFTWKSNNEDVATVDETGLVTGIHGGTTTITVTESDGRKVKTKVTVTSDEIIPESISLNDEVIGIGETKKLVPTILPANSIKIFKWESSKDTVATIDEEGNVTGLKDGTTTITLTTHNGLTAKAKITVDPKAVTSIKINGCVKSLKVGDSTTLSAVVAPSTANQTVKWSTSNGTILSVSGGKVTAKGKGSATITATANNGKTATCTIAVGSMAINSLTMSTPSFTINQGATKVLTVRFNPSNAQDYYTISWSSSNKNVATVDQNGVVTGVTPGTAVITASAGGKKATSTVTVKRTSTSSLQITNCPTSLTVNQKYTFKAQSDFSGARIAWEVSNTNLATISSAGLLTPKKVGTVTVTASSNGVEDSCTFTITDSIAINGCPSKSVEVGTLVTLTASAESGSTVTWSSSNTNVGTVSAGKVTTKGVGSTTITATSASGKSATCKINVIVPAISTLTPNPTSLSFSKTANASKSFTVKAYKTGGTVFSQSDLYKFYPTVTTTLANTNCGYSVTKEYTASTFKITVTGNKPTCNTTLHVTVKAASGTSANMTINLTAS